MEPNSAQHDAALRFLLDRIDYERMRTMPYGVRELQLQRTRRLLDRLGAPDRDLSIVHVAGTKGKGSTAAVITAILSAAGYRTGLFTSPHLERVEERMAVDGRACPAEELVELVALVRPAVEAMDREAATTGAGEIGPTYFEITTAMSLLHFARAKADLAVLEVGLGGRLDATNVCTPLVSIITSISFDHVRQLGNTLAAIAREKAGIVKPGVPVVSGVVEDEPREVIRQVCREQGSRLVERGLDFDFTYQPPRHLERADALGSMEFELRKSVTPSPPLPPGEGRGEGEVRKNTLLRYSALPLRLLGRHQAANAAVALATIAELQRAGWNVPEDAVRRGLSELVWPARVEVVARRPVIVLDAAHNRASVDALVETLCQSFTVARRVLVFATTEDKDHRGMLARLLEEFDEVLLTRYLDNPRGVPPESLADLAAELTGRRLPVYPSPAAAWEAVRQIARPDDLICVTGSFFIVGEMRRQIAARPLVG